MLLNSLTPDLSWVVAKRSLEQQLHYLWQQFGVTSDSTQEWLHVTAEQFQHTSSPLDYEIFHLLVSGKLSAALWAQNCQNLEAHYIVHLTFEHHVIAKCIKELAKKFPKHPQILALQQKDLPRESHIPHKLMVALFETTQSPTINVSNSAAPLNADPSLNDLLDYRLEEERILNNITHQIYRNQDLKATINTALKESRQLMQVDRLLIYQLDLNTQDSSGILLNQVTFEALSSPEIPSMLDYCDESCFNTQPETRAKYLQGKHLAVDNIVDNSRFSPCLKKVMGQFQVRAKLVVPVIVDSHLWGLLIAHECSAIRQWHDNEVVFLRQVAEYLAIAIIQARSSQQLQEQKFSLENLANQRAKELKDALLFAKAARQSKKEFIDIMSHELLTPLTCIIGLSNTLSYWSSQNNGINLPADKQKHYLQTIHDSGIKLRNLIQDILDFSQVEAARSVLELQPLSLQRLCSRALSFFQEAAIRQGLTLKFINQLEPNQDDFFADFNRLEKILTHLLSNALKFTSHGGSVTFKVWREELGDVFFQVQDTGIGITPKQIPLLFEKFQQLEPSKSRSYDGAGFGLALVKQLVEMHQGKIDVISTPKKGSTFTVCIPCQTTTDLQRPIKQERNFIPGGTIVLVSQDEEIATLVCELLTATNYQVIWLVDSATAIQQIEILRPFLVIVDFLQTKEPGEEMIQTLQQKASTKGIPTLLITEKLPLRTWQKLQKQGFQLRIQKPIHGEKLLEIVNYQVMHYRQTLLANSGNR